jgi:hypothetical protein
VYRKGEYRNKKTVLGIRELLVRIRIRIPRSVFLTKGSGSGSESGSNSGSNPDPTPDRIRIESGSNSGSNPDRIRIQLRIQLLSSLILRMQKKYLFSYFFLITCPQAHHLQFKKFNFLLKFCNKILVCKHYFSTFMRKGRDPDPYLCLMDPDPNAGGPKTCGSC